MFIRCGGCNGCGGTDFGLADRCEPCTRRDHRAAAFCAYCLGLAGPAAFVVLFLAAQAGLLRSVTMPMVLAFFPGWMPCALAVALTLYARGNRPARVRPLTSATTMTVRAHPDFAAALDQRSVTVGDSGGQ